MAQEELIVVVENGEDGWLIGEVPMLPGCMSQGRTIDELRANMTEAIIGWLSAARAKAEAEAHQLHSTTITLPFALT